MRKFRSNVTYKLDCMGGRCNLSKAHKVKQYDTKI
nr:MAG TPA: hypothetical protein [Caudoviricetes sp.]